MEFDFDLENPFSTSIHNFPLLFQTENDHIPSKAYLETAKSKRSQMVSLIQCFCRDFDVFSSYLAINYMDRFLSATSLPEEKPWVLRIIAISCISLALKMRKMEFSVSDFQDEVGMVVDSVTIERTEMLILGALKWRMRSVNPFCFMSFFIPLFGIEDQQPSSSSSIQALKQLKERATDYIFRAQKEMKLLEFKASVICGAALASAANEVLPSQLPHFRNSISCCEYVSKVELFNCYDIIMQEEWRRRDSSLFYAEEASNTSECSSSTSSISISVDDEIRVLKRPRIGEMSGT